MGSINIGRGENMIEPLHSIMKVGIVQFVLYPCLDGNGPILESVKRICADPYFDSIELTWIKDNQVRGEVRRIIQASGIHAAYCAHPWLLLQGLDLSSADETNRTGAINAIRQAIDDADYYGIKSVALLSGAYPGLIGKAAAMDRLEESLEFICAYARERDILILLEAFDQEFDKKQLIGKAEDSAEIAERICRNWSNFGIMVDLSHLPMLGETPKQALEPIAKYIKHVHIGNCYMDNRYDPAWGDSHPYFGYPGGKNDTEEITAFLKALFDIGYFKRQPLIRPTLSFEIKPIGSEEPETLIANAKRKLNEAWRRLNVEDCV